MDKNTTSIIISGKTLSFETNKIAKQANGSVVLTCGETILLATACANFESEETDFLPLRVDYTEKFSSAGKTLGGFIKREGKPTERETLVCRLIDRPLRPMFEEGYMRDTQIISKVLSYDSENSPEPLAICAASAALVVSDIPLIKPIAAVRVGLIDDNFIINPSITEQSNSSLDLILAGTEDSILMIEGYCDFLTEDQLLSAIDEGHENIKLICQKLSDWQKIIGKEKNRECLKKFPENIFNDIDNLISEPLKKVLLVNFLKIV